MPAKLGWKDYRCEECKQEFTRRAKEPPKICFHCEWLTSEAKLKQDIEAFDPSI